MEDVDGQRVTIAESGVPSVDDKADACRGGGESEELAVRVSTRSSNEEKVPNCGAQTSGFPFFFIDV